jgi:type IV secretory pathway VirB2 component (pilin)
MTAAALDVLLWLLTGGFATLVVVVAVMLAGERPAQRPPGERQ